jgi:hypothetical protein
MWRISTLLPRPTSTAPTIEHTELAIQQSKGGLEVFGPAFLDSVYASGLSEQEQHDILTGLEFAKEAMQDYVKHLETVVLPAAKANPRDFRIGAGAVSRRSSTMTFSAAHGGKMKMYAMALDAKKQLTCKDMFMAAAKQMWTDLFSQRNQCLRIRLTAIRA